MIRRKGPILAAAVIAAFALGWYRGLFGVQPVAPPSAPEADKPAVAEKATETAAAPTAPATEAPAQPAAPASPSEPPVETAKIEPAAPQTPISPPAQEAQPATPDPQVPPSEPASASSEPLPAAEQPAIASPTPVVPTQEQKAADAAPSQSAPGFDVVRVEPDGSTVVAGRGAANERIVLTDGSKTLGETRTDANGDFVMSLSLPTGSHRLQLAQRDDVVSDDAAVVNVPARGQPDDLLVMMQRPGEASEVLQRPTPAPVEPAATAADVAPPAAASTNPSQPAAPQVAAVDPSENESKPEETAVEPAPADAAVSVEAVEIEGDRLFVAGSAKGKPTVRIYLDDVMVAETRSGEGDRFIASTKLDVPVGDHTIRADALDASGRVVGRVEVPFQRPAGTSMAAVAPPPGAEPSASAEASNVQSDASTPMQAQTPATEAPAMAEVRPAAGAGSQASTTPQAPAATATADVAPQAVKQAALQASPSRVIIRRGDTLWRISRETYGRGSRYTVIYLANGDQIRDPDLIYPGQVFRVPSAGEAGIPKRG